MIATTIEQSKHLLELGLDPKTADMFYFSYGMFRPMKLHVGKILEDVVTGKRQWAIPAWSLSALLEVMPSNIKADEMQYYHHLEKSNGFYTVSYYFDDVDELYTLNTTKVCDDPVTAAYEMVCWLLEQGLIKKGGEE